MTEPNTLEVADLRARLRKPETQPSCQLCGEHKATDVHHLNGHHHDNRPENLAPVCKLCHDEIHGISAQLNDLGLVVRQFYALQDMRKAMSNRLSAYAKLGYYTKYAGEVYDKTLELEKYIGGVIAQMVKAEPIYKTWLQHVKGIGPTLSAAIITRIGSIGRFETISALWAYSGLDVRDGQARKRRKGEKANWNAALRVLIAYKVPSQFIKVKDSFGRRLYDQFKAFYEATHDEKCPIWNHPDTVVNKTGTKATLKGKSCSRKGHIHNMATRKVGKVFLSCLWLAWRKLEGLPVTEPYASNLPGHSHIIRPEDWVDGNELQSCQAELETQKINASQLSF